ncbi:unnamed protein product, partial [marine sediment metagenome]
WRSASSIQRLAKKWRPNWGGTCGADEQARDKLLELAEMEDCHEQTFAQVREALRVEESQSSTFDPEGGPVDLICDKPIGELLRIAIELEKESIVFYLGLRDLVPAKLGKDKVERILKEEMSRCWAANSLRSGSAHDSTAVTTRPRLDQARAPSLIHRVLHIDRDLHVRNP